MPQRKTPAAYEHLAQERGFAWLGPEVSNVRTKTIWQCPAGHQWPATYNKIQQKRGCPIAPVKRPGNQMITTAWLKGAVSSG
jgi:hypothetical protein